MAGMSMARGRTFETCYKVNCRAWKCQGRVTLTLAPSRWWGTFSHRLEGSSPTEGTSLPWLSLVSRTYGWVNFFTHRGYFFTLVGVFRLFSGSTNFSQPNLHNSPSASLGVLGALTPSGSHEALPGLWWWWCCLLVLDSVTSTPQCIRQPRPRVYLKEGTYHTRLFRGPNTVWAQP
jgi:hypothetical protein